MKIIGLTGSIGMGKSVTATLIRHLGVAVHDSDAAVHQALSPQGGAFSGVIKNFPTVYDKKKNQIDRGALGKIIFNDVNQKNLLEKIVHPHVWKSQKDFVRAAKARGDKHVVLDIPLLFETGSDAKCDKVICVTAPYFIQKQRVLSRPGMTEARFKAILANQMPDMEKRRRADFIIQTGMGRAHTLHELKKIFKVGL